VSNWEKLSAYLTAHSRPFSVEDLAGASRKSRGPADGPRNVDAQTAGENVDGAAQSPPQWIRVALYPTPVHRSGLFARMGFINRMHCVSGMCPPVPKGRETGCVDGRSC